MISLETDVSERRENDLSYNTSCSCDVTVHLHEQKTLGGAVMNMHLQTEGSSAGQEAF